jgi:hypothetical protein
LFTGTGEASQTSASDKQQCSDWDASPLRRTEIHSSPDKLIGCVFYKPPAHFQAFGLWQVAGSQKAFALKALKQPYNSSLRRIPAKQSAELNPGSPGFGMV